MVREKKSHQSRFKKEIYLEKRERQRKRERKTN